MFNHLLKTTLSEFDLTTGLVAHYLLNNNADDNHGTYDGTIVGTVDFQGDQLDPLSGSVTIPSTGGSWCSYWKDTGSGMTHITSSTIPTSLATDNYSNFRIYSETKSAGFIAALEAEGYYPKPLTEPTTTGLLAHYPLTGTAEDTTGTYDGTETSGYDYLDNDSVGSMFSTSGSSTVASHASNTSLTRTNTQATTITMTVVIRDNNLSAPAAVTFLGSNNNSDRMYFGASITYMTLGVGYGENHNVTVDSGIDFTYGEVMHIAASWDNGTVKLYKNGSLEFTDTYTATTASHRVVSIGSVYVNAAGQYDAGLHPKASYTNVRYYSRALSLSEIDDIYNYDSHFRPIDIDDGLVAYYPLADNALDNYYNEHDATADAGVTYDGTEATLPNGDNITFPSATGFSEAYYTIDGTVTRTTTESALNSLTNCTLSEVRKYNKTLTTEQQLLIGYTA